MCSWFESCCTPIYGQRYEYTYNNKLCLDQTVRYAVLSKPDINETFKTKSDFAKRESLSIIVLVRMKYREKEMFYQC